MATKGFSDYVSSSLAAGSKKKNLAQNAAKTTVGAPAKALALAIMPSKDSVSSVTATNPGGFTPGGTAPPGGAASTASPMGLPATNPGGVTVTPPGNPQGWNQGTTDPITGAIAGYGYSPQGLGMLYDNPEILANDLLAKMGISNPGMGRSVGQYLEPAAAAQFLSTLGTGSSSSDAETMNYILKYMQEQVTPNGRSPEFDYLVNQLTGAGAVGALLPDGKVNPEASPLAIYLQIDPRTGLARTNEEQIAIANAMFAQTTTGLNPYAQTAYRGYSGALGNSYLGGIAKGAPGASTYAEYLAQSGIPGWANR